MEDLLNALTDWSKDFWEGALVFLAKIGPLVLSSVMAFGVVLLIIWGAWAVLSAGVKRAERAHCFLRLLEIGLAQGRSIEETIASLAKARVREMGLFFHLLAAWMERGLRLGGALEETPGFLPRQIAAMLRVGESVGQLERMIPLCRASLGSGSADARKEMNNMLVLLFVCPAGPIVLWLIAVFILPKFKAILQDMGIQAPAHVETFFQVGFGIAVFTTLLWLGLWLLESTRGGGGWLMRTVAPACGGLLDGLVLRLPWKRKRIHRDFTATLATLLDSGVPEDKAIALAAEGTANRCFQRRAASVVASLRQGVSLADALQTLDDSGEFRWRLRNATQSRPRFALALSGWIESLDARAFQQEQCFSQVISTSFVFLNGLMVGLTAISIFWFLILTIDSIVW